MSITVIQLITDSLRLVNIINSNQSPGAEQGIQALHVLNELMADYETDGIRLGWYPIEDADISSDAPLADSDIRSVKQCLALELCPYFGMEPLQQQKENRDDAYAKLAKRKVQYVESDTSMLPMADSAYGYGWPYFSAN